MSLDTKKKTRREPWSFGAEMRRRREALGYTAQELADRSGLSITCIARSEEEHRARGPAITTAMAIAAALNTTLAEMLGGVQELSPAALEAGLLVEQLPVAQRDAVLALLRGLVKVRR
jgi:transcriptional regulator with XRE-family HTH domain